MAWASPTTDRRGVDPGRASHAGANPEGGRNALYEMAHQMLRSRQFGDDSKGLKINWTVANAGATRNVIPASATAIADVRSLNNDDLDRMEAALRESIKERHQLHRAAPVPVHAHGDGRGQRGVGLVIASDRW